MKQSIKSRIRITKTGKILRQPMGIGHSKAKKSRLQKRRKANQRQIHAVDVKTFIKYKSS